MGMVLLGKKKRGKPQRQKEAGFPIKPFIIVIVGFVCQCDTKTTDIIVSLMRRITLELREVQDSFRRKAFQWVLSHMMLEYNGKRWATDWIGEKRHFSGWEKHVTPYFILHR